MAAHPPVTIDGVAIADTLSATYYESDGLTEISNTDSYVLASWISPFGVDEARSAVRDRLGILGDAIAKSMEVV